MRKTTIAAAFATLFAAACAGDTTPSYVGTWKLNLAESDFGQLTMTIDTTMGGFRATMDGQSYTFQLDGAQNATPWGGTTAVNRLDAMTWEQLNYVNDKLASTDTMRVSADNMALTIASHAVLPSGETRASTMTFTRSAGENGFIGTWQTQNMNSSAPSTMEIALDDEAIVMKFVEIQGECRAPLDGTDAPANGPMWPDGWTCGITNHTDAGFEVALKKDGAMMYTSSYSVSADGLKLTENGGAVSTSEKVRVVYSKEGM